jgi:hypothetical protein
MKCPACRTELKEVERHYETIIEHVEHPNSTHETPLRNALECTNSNCVLFEAFWAQDEIYPPNTKEAILWCGKNKERTPIE